MTVDLTTLTDADLQSAQRASNRKMAALRDAIRAVKEWHNTDENVHEAGVALSRALAHETLISKASLDEGARRRDIRVAEAKANIDSLPVVSLKFRRGYRPGNIKTSDTFRLIGYDGRYANVIAKDGEVYWVTDLNAVIDVATDRYVMPTAVVL